MSTPEAFALVIARGGKVSAAAPLTNSTLLVQSNGVLSCPAGSSSLTVTVLGDAGIDAGGKLDVNGLGYGTEQGPGAGARDSGGWGSGGGHGGEGGFSYRQQPGGGVYDSIVAPTQWGSGGGSTYGGLGGGAVGLNVAGILRVDGTLTADGLAPTDCCVQHGAGAGGSLWINAGTLTGGGLIVARGGAGGVTQGGGGGGGGRIALYLTQSTFAGTISAVGGPGYQNGGAGTVYTKLAADAYGRVLVDNGDKAGVTRLNSSLWPAGQVFDLTISGAAIVKPDAPLTFRHLVMTNGAVVTHDQAQAGFQWTCLGNAWVASNASFNVAGLGYASETGPGAGSTSVYGYGSGAGHGGAGQASYAGEPPRPASGGGTYGSATEPITLGSGGGSNGGGAGGPGGAGGGAIRLTVAGTLQLDGAISANGLAGEPQRGSGAGGSIWITADTLAGSGSVSALGGGASRTVRRAAAGASPFTPTARRDLTPTTSASPAQPDQARCIRLPATATRGRSRWLGVARQLAHGQRGHLPTLVHARPHNLVALRTAAYRHGRPPHAGLPHDQLARPLLPRADGELSLAIGGSQIRYLLGPSAFGEPRILCFLGRFWRSVPEIATVGLVGGVWHRNANGGEEKPASPRVTCYKPGRKRSK